jgi:hypothetical protein
MLVSWFGPPLNPEFERAIKGDPIVAWYFCTTLEAKGRHLVVASTDGMNCSADNIRDQAGDRYFPWLFAWSNSVTIL